MPSPLDTLTRINLDDLVASFGWQEKVLLAALLRGAFSGAARKFARQIVEFDELVGRTSLAQASRTIMQRQYVRDVRIYGREHVPRAGPALFLSNHPGMADTISLFAAIQRTDLKIIALHRPFLETMTNTTRQLFFIDGDPLRRTNVVRQAAHHLRNGGAVLTFPAGEIEPDPLVYPGALDSLSRWTDSAGIFIRFVREVSIVPVLVSGVIWERAAHHWLTCLKRTRIEREKLAAALQLLAIITRDIRPTTVHVQFAKPITLAETGSTDSDTIHAKIMQRMRELLLKKPEGEGVSALE